jgi:hypothetical protein
MLTLPSGKTLPDNYTDQDIINTLGTYTQSFPEDPDYAFIIKRYDDAYPLSLNPAHLAFTMHYADYSAPFSPRFAPEKATELYNAMTASDQPYGDPAEVAWGIRSMGTVMAMRRIDYGYTEGPQFFPDPTNTTGVTIPPTGPIKYTLVPPPPYKAVVSSTRIGGGHGNS